MTTTNNEWEWLVEQLKAYRNGTINPDPKKWGAYKRCWRGGRSPLVSTPTTKSKLGEEDE